MNRLTVLTPAPLRAGRYAGTKGFSMAESVAQRPAMAMLFRNLARANPQVMQRYVHPPPPSY